MDNIIIVLLGIAFFVFKVYSNFKEEQEKAKKRNPSARPAATEETREETIARPTPKKEDPEIHLPKWLEDLFVPEKETPRPTPQRTLPLPAPVPTASDLNLPPKKKGHGSIDYEPVRYEISEKPADLLKEYRSLADTQHIEELKRSRAIHKTHSHQFARLEPFVLEKEGAYEETTYPTFNLREAIIQQAILERPYADL